MLTIDSLPDQFSGIAVFHIDIAGRTNQIGMFGPDVAYLVIVVFIAKEGGKQLKLIQRVGQDVARSEGVLYLLDNQTGKDGLDVIGQFNIKFFA